MEKATQPSAVGVYDLGNVPDPMDNHVHVLPTSIWELQWVVIPGSSPVKLGLSTPSR